MQQDITPDDFFCNSAHRGRIHRPILVPGLPFQAYLAYLDAVTADPSHSMKKFDYERTLRLPFREGYVDVLIRVHPEPREYRIVRFTAFPASDGPESRQIERWYWQRYGGDEKEDRSVLGEGALLDESHRW